MLNKSKLFSAILLVILLSSCQSSTQIPSNQQQPEAVMTSVPPTAIPPTETSVPTPTDTPIPTDTPLPTATPGPVMISDDFSGQSDIWGNCEYCEWKDGTLFFGPYPPIGQGEDQIFYVICESCGLHTYYRVSADVTFFDGYGDRTFGILAGLSENKDFISAGTVSTLKHALYEAFDYNTNQWVSGSFKTFSAVHASRGTNRIEIEIKPTSSAGQADITVRVNGSDLILLYNQPVGPTWAGLYLGWHTVGAIYDNFEYEEIPVD